MSKHTPGPWIAQRDPNSYSDNDWVIGVDGQPVDSVAVVDANNAHLIAAAPELLDALNMAIQRLNEIEVCNDISIPYELREAARAAIAKATGECQ